MTPAQLVLIQQWHAAKQQLAAAEALERDLRSQVVFTMFGDYGDGTRRADIGNGYELSNVNNTRHEVKDSPELRQLIRNFVAHEPTATLGAALIKDKPRLSVRAYKALPPWGVKLMHPHVTTIPQLPQLSIIPPGQ